MFNVLIRGFATKEQAKEFISWYEGQGEQDAYEWFETNGIATPWSEAPYDGKLTDGEITPENTVQLNIKVDQETLDMNLEIEKMSSRENN